jgi:hemophore
MTFPAKSPASLRRRLIGVLSGTALGGAVTVASIVPSATAAPDPCSASEMARTVGTVAKSAGDYLDKHPETNQAMTTILQQPAGPQSVSSLKSYFDAHPQVAGDLTSLSDPLTGLSTRCKLPISLPQMFGLMQGAQGALPPGLPGLPGGAAPALPVAGPPAPGSAGTLPAAPPGPAPGPAVTPPTVIR